eukprot:evm.model.scf_3778.1 EVM.evm.TU.scf_3778.1   scf_3778:353-4879(+)
MRLWLKEPLKDTACRGGFIDPRGTMHNVGSRRCQEMTSFICEFNESMTQMPEACEGEITNVSPDTISSSTAEGCGLSDGCGKEERVATGVRDDVSTDPICDPGEPKSFTELTCCSQEEYKRLCPSQVMGNITSQEEAQGDAEGHTWCNTMKTLTALLVVTCALLVMVVLISMHKKKKLTILAWLRVHVLGRPDFTSRSVQLQQAPSSQLPPSRAAMAKTRAPNPTPDEYDAPNPAFPIVDIQNILPLEGGWEQPECLVGPSRTSQSLQEAAPETSPEPRGPVGEVPEEKVDIYSFGKVMLECVTGRLDVKNEAAAKLCPGEVWELIGWCVSRDPKDRPSSEEVVGKLEGMLQCGGEWLGRSPRQDVWLAT